MNATIKDCITRQASEMSFQELFDWVLELRAERNNVALLSNDTTSFDESIALLDSLLSNR